MHGVDRRDEKELWSKAGVCRSAAIGMEGPEEVDIFLEFGTSSLPRAKPALYARSSWLGISCEGNHQGWKAEEMHMWNTGVGRCNVT